MAYEIQYEIYVSMVNPEIAPYLNDEQWLFDTIDRNTLSKRVQEQMEWVTFRPLDDTEPRPFTTDQPVSLYVAQFSRTRTDIEDMQQFLQEMSRLQLFFVVYARCQTEDKKTYVWQQATQTYQRMN